MAPINGNNKPNMSFYDWQRNVDLALLEANRRYQGMVDAKTVDSAKNNVSEKLANKSNLSNGGDTFNLMSGGTSYNQGVFNAADSCIKGMDTDGDGVISRQEFINDGMKNQAEFYKKLGMGNMSSEEREAVIKGFGNVYDAINVNKAKKGEVDGIDRKEMAAYIEKVDDVDGAAGKIGYSAFSSYNDKLATGDLK